ncbi:Lpp/OprI family alanine-zipper lipoprotein [Desulfogranum marinum]|uniref:Lpp/OprI family alanine-zipper lipoprotein n=1 Tax=Desulfogranum marinum TaxID=453220 RepID=UPI001962D63C|nr:Lpp/OprI family alanine-zipper lipoprotein [Desulfogranum marinum]MBM9510997.1 hypothetical protein [Desulfogranum marinum]
MRHTIAVLALFIAIGLTGCATTKDLDAVRLQAQQANQTADAALKTAEEAKAIAQEAKTIAQNANAMAQDADATSKTTESKIDRMFKKAMYK